MHLRPLSPSPREESGPIELHSQWSTFEKPHMCTRPTLTVAQGSSVAQLISTSPRMATNVQDSAQHRTYSGID